MIARLSQPDVADVLAKPDDGSKEQLAHLYQEKAAIEALMEERDKLHRRRVITDKMLIEGLAELHEELAGVERRIADMATQDVLSPLLADPAGVWEEISLDQRRAVIQALMTITVKPSPKGRPQGGNPASRTSGPRRSISSTCADFPAPRRCQEPLRSAAPGILKVTALPRRPCTRSPKGDLR